ncbi:hypothetical protein AA16373_2008 [Komagataeibacter swingsii DSM 16373]|nr:hypothetical protein AA16373_2008 [Komagataeibacter swingsii DSM 16373]
MIDKSGARFIVEIKRYLPFIQTPAAADDRIDAPMGPGPGKAKFLQFSHQPDRTPQFP